MSKYGSGLSSVDVCKLELEEMEEILNKYNVSKEDKKELKGMLTEAYFQLSRAYASARVLEKHAGNINLQEYMKEQMEEEQKYPFDIKDDEDGE